jgi:hypothetical protein
LVPAGLLRLLPLLLRAVLRPVLCPVRPLLRRRRGRRRLLTSASSVSHSGGLPMLNRLLLSGTCLALVIFGLCPGEAAAGRTRFHYAPIDASGITSLKVDPTTGATGERISRFGTLVEPVSVAPRPTVQIIYRHPLTGQNVTVPLRLPPDTPVLEYRSNRVIYNYGSETVEVHFLADGSVDVLYTTGLFRAAP